MGKQTITKNVVIDDLDGSDLPEDTEPVTITFDGKKYEVYMGSKSTERFMDFLTGVAPLTNGSSSATSTSTRKRGQRGKNRTPEEIAAAEAAKEAKKEQRKQIQDFARNTEGFGVPGDRGVIKGDLLEAFYKANPKAERHF